MSEAPEQSEHGEEVTVHYAKTHLSRLLREVAAGAEYVIARGNTPVARLVPLSTPAVQREFGVLRGAFQVPESFLEALPPHELDHWEGR